MSTDTTPATTVDIVEAFLAIPPRHLVAHNWGTAPTEHRHEWEVNDETYVNGVVLTVDGDFWMGYLLECVDKTSGVVTFIALNTYYGRDRVTGKQAHDFQTYEQVCGTFFNRTDAADHSIVGQWAVSRIYGMAESFFGSKR